MGRTNTTTKINTSSNYLSTLLHQKEPWGRHTINFTIKFNMKISNNQNVRSIYGLRPNGRKKNNKIVVYTAISNNYDKLRNPRYIDPSLDYVCFTDQPYWQRLANNTVWKIRPFPKAKTDPVRKNRMVKLQPHIYFSEYEYSVYVDGRIDIIGDIKELLAKYDYPIMLAFKHPLRSCIYEEGQACIDKGKEDPDVIMKQLDYYKSQGHPEQAGLIEACALIRKHNDPSIVKIMNGWLNELLARSRRDQLSFPFVARLNGFWPTTMGEDNAWGKSKYFLMRTHDSKRLSFREKLRILADVHITWRLKRKAQKPQ